MRNNFEIIVRGLVIKDGKILVCRTFGHDYFFLPGGHVEFGENIREGLLREFKEETGLIINKSKFIGTVENIFRQDGRLNHEINFVFETKIDGNIGNSREKHLMFSWLTPREVINEKFVPPVLRNAIIKWMADKNPFFILSEEEDNTS